MRFFIFTNYYKENKIIFDIFFYLFAALTRLTDSIIACKSLTYLDLSINNLEKFPDAITSLLALEELYLNDTFLEYLPANFGRLTNLRILELRDNNLITLPKSVSRLLHLRRLDIGNNEFTELPDVIGHLTGLMELWCDGNRIRRINCNVANLKELIHFDASNNLLQHLPGEIGCWQRCQEICLSTNELEELPFSIGMMKSLIALKIDENQLQELPDSICELENLEELMVSHNDLFKLPTTIGLLRRLRFLTADENLLRVLPNELCSCGSLTILSVRGNKLTKIPVDIGRLTQLRVLNVVNNFLSNLPVTILNLSQLSALWISDNQSQPLMPLQNEFNKETQSYYLTCFLLPQIMNNTIVESSPTNADSTPTAQDSAIYDYYSGSTCDESQHNAHMAALENCALAALSSRSNRSNMMSNKRKICFASEPTHEITPTDQTTRLMRSPTPYPKELRMMAKFAKNNTQNIAAATAAAAQQQHQQKFPQPNNLTNNFDEVDNNTNEMTNAHYQNAAKQRFKNVMNDSDQNQQQQQQQQQYNNFEKSNSSTHDAVPPSTELYQRVSNVAPVHPNQVNFLVNAAQVEHHHQQQQQFSDNDYNIESHNRSQPPANNYCDPSINQMPKKYLNLMPNADIVQYESFNGKQNSREVPLTIDEDSSYYGKRVAADISIDDRTNYAQLKTQQQQQHNSLQTQSLIYTDKASPKPHAENSLYYQQVAQHASSQFNNDTSTHSIQSNHEQNFNNSAYSNAKLTSEKLNSMDYPNYQQANDTEQIQAQQQPPPYHIAKAFTKKSKQDLLIYDIYRNNYQQQHQQPQNDQQSESNLENILSPSSTASTLSSSSPSSYMRDKNSNTSDLSNGAVDSDNNDVDVNTDKQSNSVTPNNSIVMANTSINSTSSKPWVFGVHKNPTVVRSIHSTLIRKIVDIV